MSRWSEAGELCCPRTRAVSVLVRAHAPVHAVMEEDPGPLSSLRGWACGAVPPKSVPERKSAKMMKIAILDDFCDSRADCTPPGPLILLIITMVWGDPARRGVRRSAFSTFHEQMMEIY